MTGKARRALGFLLLLSVFCFTSNGCKKNSGDAGEPTVVGLPGGQINPDGTLNDVAMQTVERQAGSPNLQVMIVRGKLSDAGLMQLSKFTNLRKVEAIGSPITQAGIDKLKAAIPEVEVSK